MMSTSDNIAVIPDSPASGRRVRSCSSVSTSSTSSKQGKISSRKSSSLPAETVEYLKAWMMSPEHVAHPYPTEQEKAQIMADTGIELKQLTNWFVNNRKRYWKPRVEARLQQQAQVQAAAAAAAAAAVAQVVTPNHQAPERSFSSTSQPYISLDMTQPPPVRQVVSSEEPESFSPARKVSVVGTDNMSAFIPASPPHTVSEASSSGSETDSLSASNELDDDSSALTTTAASDRKRIQGRRGSEVVRLKKRGLNVFKEENGNKSNQERFKRKRSTGGDSSVERRCKFLRKSPMLWREACHEATHCFDEALPSLEEAAHLFGFLQSSA